MLNDTLICNKKTFVKQHNIFVCTISLCQMLTSLEIQINGFFNTHIEVRCDFSDVFEDGTILKLAKTLNSKSLASINANRLKKKNISNIQQINMNFQLTFQYNLKIQLLEYNYVRQWFSQINFFWQLQFLCTFTMN